MAIYDDGSEGVDSSALIHFLFFPVLSCPYPARILGPPISKATHINCCEIDSSMYVEST